MGNSCPSISEISIVLLKIPFNTRLYIVSLSDVSPQVVTLVILLNTNVAASCDNFFINLHVLHEGCLLTTGASRPRGGIEKKWTNPHQSTPTLWGDTLTGAFKQDASWDPVEHSPTPIIIINSLPSWSSLLCDCAR